VYASVDELVRHAVASDRVINLGGGLPAEKQFPRAALTASFVRVLAMRGSPALQYGWPEGQRSLRERIARRARSRWAQDDTAADDVIITNGAQQAIALAVQALTRRGDAVGVERTSYPAALEMFAMRGRRVAPIGKARVSYVMTLGNPSGRVLDPRIYEDVRGRARWTIEDDAYGELRFNGPVEVPLGKEARAHVVRIGTFSKTLCPGLRVGWMIVPRALRSRVVRLKQGDDLQASSLSQAVIDDYLAHNDFDARLVALRRYYHRRASRLANAIRRELPSWSFAFPEGGFSLWLHTDGRVSETRFLRLAVEEGVCFDPGSSFLASHEPGAPTRLRVCYSAAVSARFDEAARRLARAWRRAVASKGRRAA
jgi:2-aminoadipate transaminase